MSPAMPEPRPAWKEGGQLCSPQPPRRGGPSPRRGAGTGRRRHSCRHGALPPLPRRPELRHDPTHPRGDKEIARLQPGSRLPGARAVGGARGGGGGARGEGRGGRALSSLTPLSPARCLKPTEI